MGLVVVPTNVTALVFDRESAWLENAVTLGPIPAFVVLTAADDIGVLVAADVGIPIIFFR